MNIDVLVEKSLGNQLKNEMEISIRAIHSVVKKYSFLHEGDLQRTQNMISEAFFLNDKLMVNDLDEIEVNMKAIVDNIPNEIKEKIYKLIQEELASKINIESLTETK